jgi:poly-gamma-glutamate synthesis protein (capsule biosynthesis protein)
MKIMKINGISPLDRPMNVNEYALRIPFYLYGNSNSAGKFQSVIAQLGTIIPATNRDESKMAVVIMTGTTALARVTLRKIDLNGIDYPIEMIKDWFLSADLRQREQRSSFNENCVYTAPYTMQFCAKPEHIKVLEALQVNVVESTGNHLNDFGGDHFVNTLKMYEERGWLNFGGGYNAESARQPALTEVNGNRIAFIGCNPAGPATGWGDIHASRRCGL